MTTLTIPTISGNDTIKSGSVITARASDTMNLVWFYVIAVVSDTHVFGVNCGNNAGVYAPDGTGFRFDTAKVEHYGDANNLTRFDAPVRDELVSFLVGAGLPSPVSGDQNPDQAYTRGVADGQAEEKRRHDAWLASLVSDAHDFADSNNLCGEFDRFMDEHGLPTRRRSYRVTVDVSATAVVYVDAQSEDDAAEMAEEMVGSDPRSYVDLTSLDLSVDDVELD